VIKANIEAIRGWVKLIGSRFFPKISNNNKKREAKIMEIESNIENIAAESLLTL